MTTDIVTYSPLKTKISNTAKFPVGAARVLAAYISAIRTGNLTLYSQITAAPAQATTKIYTPDSPDAIVGIQCADSALRVDKLQDLDPLVATLYNTSYWQGDTQLRLPLGCAGSKFHSKEIYSGPFQGSFKHPMLLIGSPYVSLFLSKDIVRLWMLILQ